MAAVFCKLNYTVGGATVCEGGSYSRAFGCAINDTVGGATVCKGGSDSRAFGCAINYTVGGATKTKKTEGGKIILASRGFIIFALHINLLSFNITC